MGGKVLVPTSAVHPHADAPRASRPTSGRADAARRPHRRRQREAAHERHRRARPARSSPASARPRASSASRGGLDAAIARGLAYAPYADLLWCETSTPDLDEAKQFAEAIHAKFPGKLLAYNCSPSFNWKKKLDDATIAKFQRELGAMGYKFQFVTLAGFHALNHSMFELARAVPRRGHGGVLASCSRRSSRAEQHGYTATRHQREVGTGYFDEVAKVISGGASSTTALEESTESAQF